MIRFFLVFLIFLSLLVSAWAECTSPKTVIKEMISNNKDLEGPVELSGQAALKVAGIAAEDAEGIDGLVVFYFGDNAILFAFQNNCYIDFKVTPGDKIKAGILELLKK